MRTAKVVALSVALLASGSALAQEALSAIEVKAEVRLKPNDDGQVSPDVSVTEVNARPNKRAKKEE